MNKENVKDVRLRDLASVPHASIKVLDLCLPEVHDLFHDSFSKFDHHPS